MITIAQNTEFKVETTQSRQAFMIIDNTGTCWMVKYTEKQALAYFNKISKMSGL